MSVAKVYKTTSMMSETPDMSWIVRGLRGVQTFLRRAIRAIENGDVTTKLSMIDKASMLFGRLDDLARSSPGILSDRLTGIYGFMHIKMVTANGTNDIDGLICVISEAERLGNELSFIVCELS